MQITAEVFADPAMRPHLEKYYNHKKDEFAKALAERDPVPESVTLPDGSKATPLGLTVDMLVDFDKWLELMQTINLFSPVENLEQARERVTTLEILNPDTPVNARTVFSNDGKLLGYIDVKGSIVVQSGGEAMLGAQDKDDIIARLKTQYPDLKITEYTEENQPTKREFAALWYPHHNIDADYRAALKSAKDHLKSMEEWATNIQKNHDAMRDFLLSSMEGEAQAS